MTAPGRRGSPLGVAPPDRLSVRSARPCIPPDPTRRRRIDPPASEPSHRSGRTMKQTAPIARRDVLCDDKPRCDQQVTCLLRRECVKNDLMASLSPVSCDRLLLAATWLRHVRHLPAAGRAAPGDGRDRDAHRRDRPAGAGGASAPGATRHAGTRAMAAKTPAPSASPAHMRNTSPWRPPWN